LNEVCEETCRLELDPQSIYIEVAVGEGSFIHIKNIKYTQRLTNKPPKQIKNLDDLAFNTTTTISIDLSAYFEDTENDVLKYSLSNIPKISSRTEGNTLIITVPKGVEAEYSGFIYVSDGRERINSNVFKLKVNTTNIEDETPIDVTPKRNDSQDPGIGPDDLPLVRTNRTSNETSPSGNQTGINASGTNSTINVTQNITGPGDSIIDVYNDIFTVDQVNFAIDPRLMEIWEKDPSARPKVLVKYKNNNQISINEYLALYDQQIEAKRAANPDEYDKESLLDRKKEIERAIEILRSIDSENGNLITANVIIDGIDIDEEDLLEELEQIDRNLEDIEIADSINSTAELNSTLYDENAGIESLNINYTEMQLFAYSYFIDELYIDDVVNALAIDSMNITKVFDSRSIEGQNGGLGVNICILDTGINTAFITNYINGTDFTNSTGNITDDNGHGTSVAYILSSIAPNSSLIVGKILNSNGQGYESQLISGLEYCRANNASIVSLSLGSGGYNGYCEDNPVSEKVAELYNLGILVVASTGNDGNEWVKVPACSQYSLPVAASTKLDIFAEFSSRNNNTVLIAPGFEISTIDENGNPAVRSGTSYSAPIVAAIAALVNSEDPKTPAQMKNLLMHTGLVINHTTNLSSTLYSRIDAYNALIGNITNNLTEGGVYAYDGTYNGTFGGSVLIANCQNITAANSNNTLTNDISTTEPVCINVFASNATIDCSSFNIVGNNATDSIAIFTNSTTTTIKNCNIRGFQTAVMVNATTNTTILNNNITAEIANGTGVRLNGNQLYAAIVGNSIYIPNYSVS
ncbi:MAG TPA: S8 family serine peptidase, partial [Alphaproteobacteria bacterium]|nr:S8 family serine peptidase [Alphaproteobacteria bacterium]